MALKPAIKETPKPQPKPSSKSDGFKTAREALIKKVTGK